MKLDYNKKYINLPNGEKLAYLEEGIENKKTLLLIHGNFSSSMHFVVLINNLKDKYHLLVPDMRGFGDSTYNNRISSLRQLGDDLSLFLNELKIKKVDGVIGWSLGAGVAMEFAAHHSDMLDRLILIAATTHKGYPIYKKDSNMQSILGEVYSSPEEMATDPVHVLPLLSVIQTQNFDAMSQAFRAMYVKDPDVELNKVMVNESLKQKNLMDADWAISNINMSKTPNGYNNGENTIKNIKCPVMHMWGRQDLYLAPEYMTLDNFNALKDKSILKTYDTSHMIFIDDEINSTKDIVEFMEK